MASAVLPVITLADLNAGDLGNGVRLIGGFESTIEQGILRDRLGRELCSFLCSMPRFFMTIPEAVQLVLQAGALAHSAEIFALDRSPPRSWTCRDLIRLSGLEEGVDVDISYSGEHKLRSA